ncbi:helix-turn-helix domain-containing protein [Symbiopectobacterium purcellii]|uniref:Helix-turn-helix domain-containing protein n=2 Tax=Symbiopectobacterium purcellii TaxID=2871826 RepID=A0ABX9AGC1_9ENTR|nr:helix-turn-helix domain-containing protein [Symbiopectobacterium purcellii]
MKEHSIYKTSAQKITQVLYEKGWNRSELARRMGLSVQAVQQWAAGATKPNGKNLTKLAETTGKPEHWFFIESSEEQESADKPASKNESTDLNQQQRRLIELFDQMPESEKGKMIHLFEEKVKEYDRLLNELIALKNKRV